MTIATKVRRTVVADALQKLASMPFDVNVANAISYLLVASGSGRTAEPTPLRTSRKTSESVEARILAAIDAPDACYSQNEVVRVAGVQKQRGLSAIRQMLATGVIERDESGRFVRRIAEAA